MIKQIQNEERMDQIDLEKIKTDDNCALIIDVMAFITFWGLSLYCGKRLLNAQENWQVYTIVCQMYTPNVHVECRARKKKHKSV